jgi:hypothetical protein
VTVVSIAFLLDLKVENKIGIFSRCDVYGRGVVEHDGPKNRSCQRKVGGGVQNLRSICARHDGPRWLDDCQNLLKSM